MRSAAYSSWRHIRRANSHTPLSKDCGMRTGDRSPGTGSEGDVQGADTPTSRRNRLNRIPAPSGMDGGVVPAGAWVVPGHADGTFPSSNGEARPTVIKSHRIVPTASDSTSFDEPLQ